MFKKHVSPKHHKHHKHHLLVTKRFHVDELISLSLIFKSAGWNGMVLISTDSVKRVVSISCCPIGSRFSEGQDHLKWEWWGCLNSLWNGEGICSLCLVLPLEDFYGFYTWISLRQKPSGNNSNLQSFAAPVPQFFKEPCLRSWDLWWSARLLKMEKITEHGARMKPICFYRWRLPLKTQAALSMCMCSSILMSLMQSG